MPFTLSPLEKRAFKFLELTVLWEGRFNKSDWIEQLAIGKTTATNLIATYKTLCLDNLNYDASAKAYLPSEHFIPLFSSGLLDDYLAQASAELNSIERLNSSHATPNPKHVRPIIQAIQKQQRLDIRYASIKNPEGDDRIISPHSLVNNGQRWHVRAWCEKSIDYRDFVLSRIREVYGENDFATQTLEQDQQWNTWIQFSIEPDPRLPQSSQALIALDYGMQLTTNNKYQRHYKVRAALVMYWMQSLRIDRYREIPEAQQIILSPECAASLREYLP